MKEYSVTHKEVATVKAEDKEKAKEKAISGNTETGWKTNGYNVEELE